MSVTLMPVGGPDVDSEVCTSRAGEVQQLAWRMTVCADQVDAVLAKLAQLQLNQWESPAGRAYRTTIALQAASLRRGRDALSEAAAATLRHAAKLTSNTPSGF
ncbi:hypothetical protein GCM10023063_46410 [Arthrobacter methylotrophus]|uniref:Uncharacterized protein n=1 Tax=Arthrobacter methylotrophus TaxID=121291 RepID=A0ABV5UVM8_9MICC